jgi:hypothetical protein
MIHYIALDALWSVHIFGPQISNPGNNVSIHSKLGADALTILGSNILVAYMHVCAIIW